MSKSKSTLKTILSLLLVLSVVFAGLLPNTAAYAAEVNTPGSKSSSSVTLTTEGLMMSVTVPTSVLIYVDERGEVTTPDYLQITNHSIAPVYAHSLEVTPFNGWTLDPSGTNYKGTKFNSRNYWLSFNGLDASSGLINLATPISGSSNLSLDLLADVAPQNDTIHAFNIGQIVVTVGWDMDEEGNQGGDQGGNPDQGFGFSVEGVTYAPSNMLTFTMNATERGNYYVALVPPDSTPPMYPEEAPLSGQTYVDEAGSQEHTVEFYSGEYMGNADMYVWGTDPDSGELVGPIKVKVTGEDGDTESNGEFIPDGYVLATDDDFSGTQDGMFKYIGSDNYVVVPYKIKGKSVSDYGGMFKGSSVKGVASDNPNIFSMDGMFEDSQSSSLELTYFNTSGVNWMRYMFRGSQATELDLSNFDTSSVTWMGSMFNGSQATSLNLSSFDISQVTDMSEMFRNSKATILDLSSFDMSNLSGEAISQMFRECSATIGYARTQADADIFNATSSKPLSLTFYLEGYEPPEPPEQTGPEWVIAKDSDFNGNADGEFTYKGTAEYVIIPDKIKFINVTSYENMFKGTAVKGVKSTNPNVTVMHGMFEDSTAESLDLSELDTSGVTNMANMFRNSKATTIDLSNFDTTKVTTMVRMFERSEATTLDLSTFDVSKLGAAALSNMLTQAKATTGYARTEDDATKLNNDFMTGIPMALNFTVK